MDKLSYSLGVLIGSQLKDSGITKIETTEFAQAVADVLTGRPTVLSTSQAQTVVNEELRAMQAQRGEAFLAKNAQRQGVKTLASGLQYEVLSEGKGKKPTVRDSVKCHYEGHLTDGTVFDSSIKRGEPAVFPLGGVIKGWTEGLQLMSEGSKYRFFIPYQLAYGASGAGGSIPPYAALIFDVELIAIM